MQPSLPFLSDGAARTRARPGSRARPLVANAQAAPDDTASAPIAPADDIARGAARLLEASGYRTLFEMRLASGRRVDVIGLDGRGRFAVVEVKSCLADLRADAKWPEYLPYCDRFYFAVAPAFPVGALPEETGIILADRFAGDTLRAAPLRPMAAGTRRRQTLLFAHTASWRLFRTFESSL